MKQLAKEHNQEISVCVIDQGSTIGSHIISGNVFEPRALNELFPNWKDMPDIPLQTKSTTDEFHYLTETSSIGIPSILHPPQLHNDGNYIISLSQLVTWLGAQAEELGVEIYPGFAADEVLYSEDGKTVRGVATKDAGISKTGEKKDTFTRGIELLGKQTLFAEGCRGSCSEDLMAKFNLREGKDVQTYGLGVKEVWRVPKENIKPGHIQVHKYIFILYQMYFFITFHSIYALSNCVFICILSFTIYIHSTRSDGLWIWAHSAEHSCTTRALT